jgi:exodeoxyribonuclease-3
VRRRGSDPQEVRRALPGDPEDLHSRYIEAVVDGVTIGCLYLPNGNPAPGPKFDYKLRWLDRLLLHAAELVSSSGPVVLAGDFNVIPTERDVYKPERWVDDALFRVEVRETFARLLSQGWTDSIRTLHPDKTIFTFWASAAVDRHVRGWERASDHAPTWIELREAAPAV